MIFEVVIFLTVNFERMILVDSVAMLDFAMLNLTRSFKSNNISQHLTTCLLAFVRCCEILFAAVGVRIAKCNWGQ